MCTGIAHNDIHASERPGDILYEGRNIAYAADVGDKPFRLRRTE